MGLFDHFPYTNFHELNLDWILRMLQEIDKTMSEFVAINALKYADPIQWNIVSQYEKNTIVIDPLTGTAYISVQPVPSGVSLTNTDYWTVVFDLGQFVVKAAKNFCTRYEEATTLTATFPSSVNDWLIWGDTLYRALVNITAGDSYVVDSNIKQFTVEDVVGHIQDLNTTDKSNLVAAINELLQTLLDTCGDLDNLTTTDKSNLVAAINEVLTDLGNLLTAGSDADFNDVTLATINGINFNDFYNNFISQSMPVFTQIYIDSVSGSDTNSGTTPSDPIKTLDHGLTLLYQYQNAIGFVFMSDHTETLTASSIQVANIQMDSTSYDVNVNLTFSNNIGMHFGYFNPTGSAAKPFVINGDITGDGNSIYLEHCIINGNITARFNSYVRMDNTTVNGNLVTNHGEANHVTINGTMQINGGIFGFIDLTVTGALNTYNHGIINANDATTLTVSMLGLRTGSLYARSNLTIDCNDNTNTYFLISLWGGSIITQGNLTLNNTAGAVFGTGAIQLRGGIINANNLIDNTSANKTIDKNGAFISNLAVSPKKHFGYVTNSYVQQSDLDTRSYYINNGNMEQYFMRFKIQSPMPYDSGGIGIQVGTIPDPPQDDVIIHMIGVGGSTAETLKCVIKASGEVYANPDQTGGASQLWFEGLGAHFASNNKITG